MNFHIEFSSFYLPLIHFAVRRMDIFIQRRGDLLLLDGRQKNLVDAVLTESFVSDVSPISGIKNSSRYRQLIQLFLKLLIGIRQKPSGKWRTEIH
jgi:hypothetical protein